MTKQQKQLKNFLESLLLNYGNAKNPLSKVSVNFHVLYRTKNLI